MKKNLVLFILLSFLLSSSSLYSQGFAIGVKASTLGISFELNKSLSSNINVKGGGAFFNYSTDGGGGSEDYEYTGDLKLGSAFLLFDWFPFHSSIRITTGALINLNEAEVVMTPTDTYTIGGDVYTPDLLGTLSAKVDFQKFSPYIGLGIGNPTSGDSGLKFTFDLGTIYQGSPNVDLSATGLISPSASPDQEETIEDNIKAFKWYPVLSIGLAYKF